LELATVLVGTEDLVQEGLLHCGWEDCRLEYPIIDGIPIIVPDVRGYIANNISQIHRRGDLSAEIEGLLGDALGPGSDLDQTRQHLSIYCWGHYGDLDPEDKQDEALGSVLNCLKQGFSLPISPSGNGLDLGCSVGRTTFELATRIDGFALGIDLNFAMLKTAQEVLQTGRLSYGRRRLGLVSDQREFPVQLPARESVDFWACDTLALPFVAGQFGTVLAINLLDCVASPRDLLAVVRGMLKKGGSALISTPYDWSPNATPVEAWIGGHSQRGPDKGAAEPLLRALLTPGAHPQSVDGLIIAGEIEGLPWLTRLHERSTVNYSTHVVAVRAT
jgi:SAM-dependent methyltransferase